MHVHVYVCICMYVVITDFDDDEAQPLSSLSLCVCDTLQSIQTEISNSKKNILECFQEEEKINESEGFLKLFPLLINNLKNEKSRVTYVNNEKEKLQFELLESRTQGTQNYDQVTIEMNNKITQLMNELFKMTNKNENYQIEHEKFEKIIDEQKDEIFKITDEFQFFKIQNLQLINEEKNKVIAARLSEKENSASLESEIVKLKSELDDNLIILVRPACLRECVVTSGRRWERHGVWRTILLMWRLRALYWLGVSPQRLARSYRAVR